jgi:hypothetical protein
VDDDSSWLLSAFPVCPALSVFLFNAEAVPISLAETGSKLVSHSVYSREHLG